MAEQSRYEELTKKHNIVSVMGGSDLVIDPATGGLMWSKRGTLMWQGKSHNAMFQFVRDFEMKASTLKRQFAEILESNEKEAALVNASNMKAEKMVQEMMNGEPVDGDEMRVLSDEQGATKTGREIVAASIFIELNKMLKSLQAELGIDDQKFQKSEPLYSGQSFGNVVWAASNNARHADEWRVHWIANKSFKGGKGDPLKSVRVLAPVLGHEENEYRFLAGEICDRVLAVLSNGDFDILERGLFTFANNLAVGVENIK